MNTIKEKSGYRTLLKFIQKEFGDSEVQVESFAGYAKVEESWNVGRLIVEHLLYAKRRAGHKEKVPPKSALTWSHYRRLVSISDSKKRKLLEEKVLKEGLNAHLLGELVRKQKLSLAKVKSSGKKLTLVRGSLFLYRTILVKGILGVKTVMIDCGFSMRIEKPLYGSHQIKNGFVVLSKNLGPAYRIQYSNISHDQLYTYKAYVQRIVDGDTIVVNVDCGFGLFTEQKIRLRGINSPEISRVAGMRAKRFVEDQLSKCKFVIIKTYQEGKYGRYISDVFYSHHLLDPHKVASKGKFLNQDLVDNDFAKIVK